ncbi:MAG TPA: TolC family protein [Terriglobales bacterium]|nr:TolC family protein [Terriglobales bacterium]
MRVCMPIVYRTLIALATTIAWLACAQTMPNQLAGTFDSNGQSSGTNMNSGSNPANPQNTAAPQTITLRDALQMAKKNSPDFQAALTGFGLAREDRVQARAALLPSVGYNGQFLYTQGNGSASGRFIANNGVHEYISQGNAHQVFSYSSVSDFRRARAAEAVAKAKAEIAARGLVVAVTRTYYTLVTAEHKYSTAQLADAEAQHFLNISEKLEHGGEVAHSDVIKAQIQYQQQHRDLQESQLAMERARLDLAVLLFPDFNQNFTVVDDLQSPQPVPTFGEVANLAANKNPDLRAALSSLQAAQHEVGVAFGGLLPTLTLDYFYGIDANRFAVNTFDPITNSTFRNLGYSASATLQFPVWTWGAGWSKVKQAKLQRGQAQVELSFAQRQLLANLRAFYAETETSRSELESLRSSAELAAESLRLTNMRYQAGEATVLEVVDAQNTFTQARNAYSDGQARFSTAIATLQTLTGSF